MQPKREFDLQELHLPQAAVEDFAAASICARFSLSAIISATICSA
jgi:hypothetical protein